MSKTKKKLIIRLSSLGDVILAASALEVLPVEKFDWVVSREYQGLLEGHPGIRKLWCFDRSSGLSGWVALACGFWKEGYDEVYDLHSTLRSAILKGMFRFWSLRSGRAMPAWKKISKRRFGLYGYFFFKSLWPKGLRPNSMVARSALLCGGTGKERPDLRHLLSSGLDHPELLRLRAEISGRKYVCVMPGSKWDGKKWPVESFVELLSRMNMLAVVMGTSSDVESRKLVEMLKQRGRPVVSAVGNWGLKDVARILSGAWRYIGNDTGLAHLAEAVGIPSIVIFGPTREDMGFGPWGPESRAVGLPLSCRPCGKDGRYCYRFGDRFACLRHLKPDQVLLEAERG